MPPRKKADREVYTKDYPHNPQYGDQCWRVYFSLDDGSKLAVNMGRKGRDILFGMLIADCHDSGEGEPDASTS